MGMGGSDGCRNDTLLIVTELKYIYIFIYIYIQWRKVLCPY